MTARILLFSGTLVAGLVACRVAVRMLTGIGMFDDVNERSSHARTVPRGGGVGIMGALLPGALTGWLLFGLGSLSPAGAAAMLGGAAVLFGLGLLDDRRGIRPAVKAVPQVGVAVLFVVLVGSVHEVSLPWGVTVHLGALAAPLTVFWLVGFSNGFNFMDGIDGVAALHAGLASMTLTVASLWGGSGGLLWLSLPMAGAAFAFLAVNWSPARVFMGDCGSLPLGYLLAGLAVAGRIGDGIPFLTCFLALGPFLFDTLYTLARRVCRGENILEAHRSHLYQRMVIAGWSHARVSLLYGAWTLLSGALGILYLRGLSHRGLAIAGGLAAGFFVVAVVMWLERAQGSNGA